MSGFAFESLLRKTRKLWPPDRGWMGGFLHFLAASGGPCAFKEIRLAKNHPAHSLLRRQFLGQAGALAVGGFAGSKLRAQSPPATALGAPDLLIVNARIHTMDPGNRVVSQALIQNGRFTAVGDKVSVPPGKIRRVDLRGKTVIPGIIDAHNHIVLVGNRPGWNTPLEHVFTIPEAIAVLKTRSADVPSGEFISTIGPISAMQLAERRLPSLTELDAVSRPVYIQAAQGGARTNTQGKAWLEARGVTVAADGAIAGPALTAALLALRKELLNPETRKRSAHDALRYYARLGITTHRDCGAFQADAPSGGLANENTYTMHDPFLALHRDGNMPARLRIEFLHQDSPTANPPLPTLSQRLKNSFPFFGDEWVRTGGIGEFTGGGVEGLRAIAWAGWQAEDHALNLAGVTKLIQDRETVNAEIPLSGLRWIISHVPEFPLDLANRMDAMGMGVLVGLGRVAHADARQFQPRQFQPGTALPDADESQDPERLSFRRRRHYPHQSLAQLFDHVHGQESRRAADSRGSGAHPPGSAVAGYRSEQMVSAGGRSRVD